MNILLSMTRKAVGLTLISLLSGAAFAGPEEVERALSRAVRSPNATSLSEASKEVKRSLPGLFTKVFTEGTPIHPSISREDKGKSFLQLKKGGLIILPLFAEEKERGAPQGVSSAESGGIELENLVIKPVLRRKLGASGHVLMMSLHLSLREDWGEAASSIVVKFALETASALATCQVVLGETFLLEDAHKGMVSVVEAYPDIRVGHVVEINSVEDSGKGTQFWRALNKDNDRLRRKVEDLTQKLRERERQHQELLMLRMQEKREAAAQALGMLGFLRKLYYNIQPEPQEVDDFMRFFTHRQYTQEQYARVGYDRIMGQVQAFLGFCAAKHRLMAEVEALKRELRSLKRALGPNGQSLQTFSLTASKDAA